MPDHPNSWDPIRLGACALSELQPIWEPASLKFNWNSTFNSNAQNHSENAIKTAAFPIVLPCGLRRGRTQRSICCQRGADLFRLLLNQRLITHLPGRAQTVAFAARQHMCK